MRSAVCNRGDLFLRVSLAIVALAVANLNCGPACAPDRDDALATVARFKDYGNKMDQTSAAALCTDKTTIVDMFSPFLWSGADACAKWMKAGDAYGAENRISDGVVTFGNTPQIVIAGDRAYAAMPTTFTYKIGGRPAAAPLRSVWTYTLQKLPAGWRITSLNWGLR